ncbi:helix-turn-helix domain-containing protein [Muriicola sp. Z0-33]|uniref:helix-turn-helix domain-containing protein n=1 Tax=Muriicola sp. Z0-33 TaxID=2816957 RepID=UPI0022374C66|nr:helix-turn-helix domain-containing protein [Muriicola sp. Z0-33]MCW5518117.1 AraC family transcriptional regulator [Muriicola sp. Z0-33]
MIIDVIGISILSIFLLFIISKKNKIISDYYLMLIIILFSGILGSDIWMKNGLSLMSFLAHLFFNTFTFPCLILYGLLLISENGKVKKRWFWVYGYGTVFFIFIVLDTMFFNEYNADKSISNLLESPSMVYLFLYNGHYAFVIGVLLWFLKKINNYRKRIKNYYSSIEFIHLNWFRYFVYTFLVINVLSFFLFLSFNLGIITNINTPFNIVYALVVLSLFYLCYNGIRHYSNINIKEFQDSLQLRNNGNAIESGFEKYKSSSLTDNEMNSLFEEIKNLFDFEEIYLEPQLKIDEIAKQLEVTTHKISQTINSKASKPFYDYVNAYRVNHFKQLLSNPENRKFTILALGIESGFNSKASLNRIFKQTTGMGPKEYQKKYSKN